MTKKKNELDVLTPSYFGFAEDESQDLIRDRFIPGQNKRQKDAAALVRAFAEENLPKVESKDSRETLEAQLNRLEPSFERLKQLFEPWRLSNPEKFHVVWDERGDLGLELTTTEARLGATRYILHWGLAWAVCAFILIIFSSTLTLRAQDAISLGQRPSV